MTPDEADTMTGAHRDALPREYHERRLDEVRAQVARNHILRAIGGERERQEDKWGVQNHPDGTGDPDDAFSAGVLKRLNGDAAKNWRNILAEEVYEAFAESDRAALRAELIQVAAVAVAWVEDLDSHRA